jgi:TolA-binding protein
MKKIFLLLSILSIFACANQKRQEALDKIKDAEKKLTADLANLDIKAAKELIQQYDAFVTAYPKDTSAANAMFKAGDLSQGIGEYGKAIKYWGDLREGFPAYRLTPDGMFLQAFTYENSLQDKDNAKRYYSMFLEKYPNHELAASAKTSLEQIDIPLEELVKKFQQQAK